MSMGNQAGANDRVQSTSAPTLHKTSTASVSLAVKRVKDGEGAKDDQLKMHAQGDQ